jgi:hypothetical protein
VTNTFSRAQSREIIAADHELLVSQAGERAANDAEWEMECVTSRADRVNQQLDI